MHTLWKHVELSFVFQPIYRFPTYDLLGLEALCRPTYHGIPLPVESFFDAALAKGLGPDLDFTLLPLVNDPHLSHRPEVGACEETFTTSALY
jgi:EAL domain-containing protein (putative c-di-GMP-specific phosphodiesterase class I)